MLTEIWFHVDMDAFYASVEQADNAEYRSKPVIVGAAPGKRGVVSACSYEARVFGVHSAMPISQAYRLCPNGIYVRGRMRRYKEVSNQIMDILSNFSPTIEQISIDEAFIDMTGTEKLWGTSREAALLIKKEIIEKTGLTISVGVAPNKFLAKMASDKDKPNGLFIIHEGEELDFINSLQLKDLWGLGKKTLERLIELNIDSIEKLRKFDEALLKRKLGKASGSYLYKIVRGQDPGVFTRTAKSKSISSERTFGEDTRDRETISKVMLNLSKQIMFQLFEKGYKSRTPYVKIRFADFSTTTVQETLKHYLTSSDELYQEAMTLLKKRYDFSTPVRLIGLGVQIELGGEDFQGELFEDENSRKKRVEETIISLSKKLKKPAFTKASLLKKVEDEDGKYKF